MNLDDMPVLKKCPVCEGACYWYSISGSPCFTKPPPNGVTKCMYCNGKGVV